MAHVSADWTHPWPDHGTCECWLVLHLTWPWHIWVLIGPTSDLTMTHLSADWSYTWPDHGTSECWLVLHLTWPWHIWVLIGPIPDHDTSECWLVLYLTMAHLSADWSYTSAGPELLGNRSMEAQITGCSIDCSYTWPDHGTSECWLVLHLTWPWHIWVLIGISALKIDDISIERVAEFNFLGLTLDEHLTWKCHLNKISNKISQCIGILNRLKNTFSQFTQKLSFTTLWCFHI